MTNLIIDHHNNTRLDIGKAVKEFLRNGTAKIVFTKVDGTIREMICTLKKDILKEHDALSNRSSNGSKRRINEDVVRVFDLEKKAWRSFRIDSLHTVESYEEAVV